ncbi:MAG TPA: hypothetical protein VM077_05810 [Candidatus Limnocylindrales bacterium]|nr:hypothetical protein [Candidatus Limnocylindrales bacterium]
MGGFGGYKEGDPGVGHTMVGGAKDRPTVSLDLTRTREGNVSASAPTINVVYEASVDGDATPLAPTQTQQFLREIGNAGIRLGSPRRGFHQPRGRQMQMHKGRGGRS